MQLRQRKVASDDEKREQIQTAALELFAARGVNGTAVPEVIKKAGVGASMFYRLYESKDVLVNAVFRDAKRRLGDALSRDLDQSLAPRALFCEFWDRLVRFARAEPVAFRFLELQDHEPYLDAASRAVELAVLGPVYLACHDFQRRRAFRRELRPDAMMAFIWGAFVGLIKAERTGYLRLDDDILRAARDACLRAFALPRAVGRGARAGSFSNPGH